MKTATDLCDICGSTDGNGVWSEHPIPGVYFKGPGRQEKSLTDYRYRCGACRLAVWEQIRKDTLASSSV